MNVQHTERDTKWQFVSLRNRDVAQADTQKPAPSNGSKSQGWHQMKPELTSLVIYYAATLFLFPMFYGFYDPNFEYLSGSFNLAAYRFICSLIPLFCMAYLACKLLLDSQNATRITKILSVVYFGLVINNVVMAIDAVENLEQWIALDNLDTFIHGSSDWIIPFGASDFALVTLGVLCLLRRYS